MRIKKIMIVLLIVIVGIFLLGAGLKAGIERNLERLADSTIPRLELENVEDGVYTGSHKVFPVAAEVKVTVKDHKITDIVLLEHNNGQGAAAVVIPEMVVKAQTLEVDTISGATYSSKVILKAISNALSGENK
ncbi:MAG TPA: FMN-binding protein [Clostridia bacterium]|nr:FMN-binding protein [Clostridia bacterium]